MNLKEKLLETKKKLFLKTLPVSKKLEFETILENHPVGNQNIYRLYFVNYHRIGENYGREDYNIGVINWPCKPFMFPESMSREEGFKVLSYLTDFIEKRDDIEPCSMKSVRTLDSALNLERFGFKRVEEEDESKILDLFTINGRVSLFKESKLYSRYFEWYVEDVTLEEVTGIYAKYNMKFSDIVWLDQQNNKEYSKVLRKKK